MSMQVTAATFEQEVLASDIPVLVDFYADDCGPCKAAAPTIDTLAEEYAGKIKVVKVDVYVEKNDKLALDNSVRGIPNFIIFKGGKRVAQFVGWSDKVPDEIRAALNAVLASN